MFARKEFHYVSFKWAKLKMVSSVIRCTEYTSPLCVLKVKVITSCQALKGIHLTIVTY